MAAEVFTCCLSHVIYSDLSWGLLGGAVHTDGYAQTGTHSILSIPEGGGGWLILENCQTGGRGGSGKIKILGLGGRCSFSP